MMISKFDILRWIGIYPEEIKLVKVNYLLSFLLGTSLNLSSIIPISLFLTHYSSSVLTTVYMYSGIAVFLSGFLFSFFKKKFSFFKFLYYFFGFVAISFFIFGFILITIKIPSLIMAFLIWCVTLQSFLLISYGLLTSKIFTLQQNKRLSGFISSGFPLGSICSGLMLPFLIRHFGTYNIIFLISVMLLLALMCIHFVKANGAQFDEGDGFLEIKTSFLKLKNKKLVLFIWILTILVTCLFVSFDLLFNNSLKLHYHSDAHAIAAFLGSYSVICAIFYFGTSLLLSKRILTRFGLTGSFLLQPLSTIFLMSLLFIFSRGTFFAESTIFLFIAGITGLVRVLLMSVNTLSFRLLYQPLDYIQMSWAQIKSQAVVIPISFIIFGIILSQVVRYFGVNITEMSAIIICICVCSIIIIALASKEYVQALINAISNRLFINPEFTLLDRESLKILKKHLKSQHAEEVIYCLSTMESVDQKEFIKSLLESLSSDSSEVRLYCLEKVEHYRIQSAAKKTKELCLLEKDPRIVAAAYLAWASVAPIAEWEKFEIKASDFDSESRRNVIIAAIKYGTLEKKEKATALLIQKGSSSDARDQIAVAKILKFLDIPEKGDLLLTQLQSPNPELRLVACDASAGLNDERFIPYLIECLRQPDTYQAAFNSLRFFGDHLVHYLSSSINHLDIELVVNVIRVFGFLASKQSAILFLKSRLESSNVRIAHAAVIALRQQSYKTLLDDEPMNHLLMLWSQKISKLFKLRSSFSSEATSFLHDIITREIEITQEFVLFILSFLYPKDSIAAAIEGFLSRDVNVKSYSIELLISILNKKHKQLIESPLMEVIRKEETKEMDIERVKQSLMDISHHISEYFFPGMAAAVLYTMGLLKITGFADFIRSFDGKGDPLIEEVKRSTFVHADG